MVNAIQIDTCGQLIQITINMDDFKAPHKFLKTNNVTFVGAIDDLVLIAGNDSPGPKELNNTNIGGKKRSFYHDDIWNLKYLKGFKWRHLNEKLAYDRRMHETRLNAEMAQATRENNAYVEHVEQARLIAKIEARKKRKNGGKDDGSTNKRSKHENQIHRQFKQIKAVKRSEESERKSFKKSTLSKIFK